MPEGEILRGADAVNDELEVGYDNTFETRWHRAELIGRAVGGVVIAAGLAGLLGRGPFSHRVEHAGPIWVDYEPVVRAATPTQVTLHVRPPQRARSVTVTLSSSLFEPMGLTRMTPLPTSERTDGGDLVLEIAVPGGPGESLLRLNLQPNGVGPVRSFADVGEGGRVAWTQVVLP